MRKLIFTGIADVLLAGCANDTTYRLEDPKTCIDARGNQFNSEGSCTTDQAKVNRAALFKQCKDLGGTPSMRQVIGAFIAILGVDCLMPDGEIKDIYGEKFEKDTGKKLYQ